MFSESKTWIFSWEHQQQIVDSCVVLGAGAIEFGARIVVLIVGVGTVVVAGYFHFIEQSGTESTKHLLRRPICIQETLVT